MLLDAVPKRSVSRMHIDARVHSRELRLMVKHLRDHREQHTAVHKVPHTRLRRRVDERNAHRGLERVERGPVVEHSVDARERGRERVRLEEVPDGVHRVRELREALLEAFCGFVGAHEEAQVGGLDVVRGLEERADDEPGGPA